MYKKLVKATILESIQLKKEILNSDMLIASIVNLSDIITNAFLHGSKVVICGNGGSASDALHFAGELIGRYERERDAWPVVVLNSDVATMTAISNDYGYDQLFARQVRAHLKEDDVFIGISTSGNSKNIIRAVKTANELGGYTVGLLGKDGGQLGKLVQQSIVIPSDCTARIQEAHILIIHILCKLIEEKMSSD